MEGNAGSSVQTGGLFSLDYLKNQVVWYGPYLADGEHYTLLSSSMAHWPPSIDYSLTCWVFDHSGNIVGEKLLLEGREAGRPVTVDLRQEFTDLPLMKGALGVHVRPADPKVVLPAMEQEWCLRYVNSSGGLQEVIATAGIKDFNFPARRGRKSTFRLYSPALLIDDDWESIAFVINGSANPEYDTRVNLKIAVFNDTGQSLDTVEHTVAPFGSAWLSLSELFGDRLPTLLADSDGRGSYTIESDDAGCIGYHFFYSPASGKMGGDHTRPVVVYVSNGYGIRPLTSTSPGLRDFLRHAKFLALRRLAR